MFNEIYKLQKENALIELLLWDMQKSVGTLSQRIPTGFCSFGIIYCVILKN